MKRLQNSKYSSLPISHTQTKHINKRVIFLSKSSTETFISSLPCYLSIKYYNRYYKINILYIFAHYVHFIYFCTFKFPINIKRSTV